MRGRLIFPFGIEIYQLDTVGTAVSPGYDPVFREPSLVQTPDGMGRVGRHELTPIILPGQFNERSEFMRLQMAANGNLAKSDFRILFHFAGLEDAGLVEPSTGFPLIGVGDRMSAVYDVAGVTLLQAIPNPPGLFVTEAKPVFGLGGTRNLLQVTFASRDQGQGQGAS